MEQLARDIISRLTIRRLVVASVLYWTPIVVVIKLSHDVAEHDPMAYDAATLRWVHGLASPVLDRLMPQLTNLGDAPFVVAVALLVCLVLLARRHYRDLVQVAAGVGGAVVIDVILKFIFARPRPHMWHRLVAPPGYSFPSAHAMMSLALALSLIFLAWPTRWRWPVLGVGLMYSLAIGCSRLYLGVHYPTDVLGGWCMALIWVLVVAHITHGRWIGMGRIRRRGRRLIRR